MNGQHIPGFYFDKEKGKYFKIQSQSQARGLNLKYSTSNLVKERRKENVQRSATAKSKRIQKERVIRRHAHAFTQTDLDREIGFMRRSTYLHNIWPEACMSGLSPTPDPVISSDEVGIIRFFDRDPVSKQIYAVCGENTIQRRHYLGDDQASNLRNPEARRTLKGLDTRSRYGYYPWDEIGRTTSTVSSMQYMPSSGALAVTTIGSDRPPVVHLSDPERDGPHIYQKFTPKACAAIFCSAARPPSYKLPSHPNSVAASDTELLAVGAQSSLLLFTRSSTGTWDSSTLHDALSADILALSWLSPHTLAAGCRTGKIHLCDLRSRRSTHALTHPYAISSLSRADDPTRLICAGLQDTLIIYDLRMPRFESASHLSRHATHAKSDLDGNNHHYNDHYFKSLYPGFHDHKRRKQLKRRAVAKWSQPLLSFEHTNLDDLSLAVAVNERLGLVAAAQDVDHGELGVRVSNMWTGKVVREFKAPGKGEGRGKVRGLRWMDDDDGEVSLWAGWEGGIGEYAW